MSSVAAAGAGTAGVTDGEAVVVAVEDDDADDADDAEEVQVEVVAEEDDEIEDPRVMGSAAASPLPLLAT